MKQPVEMVVAPVIAARRDEVSVAANELDQLIEAKLAELKQKPNAIVSNMYNFWADTLRLVQSPTNNMVADPYLAYVKDSIRENKQYDQWVYEMLTADGKLWEHPAVGFQLRDDGMPLPYVDNTVRVFLGTQIGCAQCHNHPFDHWTQHQFYELAAFTTGTKTRNLSGGTDMGKAKGKANSYRSLMTQAEAKYPNNKVPAHHCQSSLEASSWCWLHRTD